MSIRKAANSFPDRDTPGDPRLLAAIERRTASVAGSGSIRLFGGTVITTPRKSKSGKQVSLGALVVTSKCPKFIAPPTGAVAEGTLRVWVTYGTINSKVATNLTDHFDITTEKAIYAKATFTTSGGFAITSWVIEVQSLGWAIPAPSGPRPDTGYYQLGAVHQVGDNLVLSSSGSGSLTVWPQISNSLSGSTADTTIVWRR